MHRCLYLKNTDINSPIRPLFCLVLHKVVKAIAADCANTSLLLKQWYMDNGVLAGPPLSVSNALNIIRDIGPTLGNHPNPSKCELFNRCNDFKLFPPETKTSTSPISISWDLLMMSNTVHPI